MEQATIDPWRAFRYDQERGLFLPYPDFTGLRHLLFGGPRALPAGHWARLGK